MKQILPAYPLFIFDPYFSIWAKEEELNNDDTIFWTGQKSPVHGVVFVDGEAYSFLGKTDGIKKLNQKTVIVRAFSTDYTFENDLFSLSISFISPLLPDDLEVLSCPVCYFSYEITPKVNLKEVTVSLIVNEKVLYDEKTDVRGGVFKLSDYEASWFGLRKQQPLAHVGDPVNADWGYYYLTGDEAYYLSESEVFSFYNTGIIEPNIKPEEERYLLSCNRHQGETKIKGKILLAFDDCIAINYFGFWLKGFFFKNGRSIIDAIEFSFNNYEAIMNKLEIFDRNLKTDIARYGEDYYLILCAALRQSIGAHKLVADYEGNILFLSKECLSNGCIATVDVSYPSLPLFLLYNPELVEGMLRPVFRFSRMPVWPYDFAPHDCGTYPYCCGQTYGLTSAKNKYLNDTFSIDWKKKETFPLIYQFPKGMQIYDLDRQMPVEESSNMLIMSLALLTTGKNSDFIKDNLDLLKKWAEYLVKEGIKPKKQLCTDDFAGHLEGNVNLSIKSILGIQAFGVLLDKLGNKEEAVYYLNISKDYSRLWEEEFKDLESIPLSFSGEKGSFSLKYNLVIDKLFNFKLFNPRVINNEIENYLLRMNKYGVPLDNRATYTKSDWMVWVAALSDNLDVRKKFLGRIVKYLNNTPNRVPFSDWYDTITGEKVGFQNRSVQGGLFILMLIDKQILKIN